MRFPAKFLISVLLPAALIAGVQKISAQGATSDPLRAWKGGNDPAQLESWINRRLAEEKSAVDKLLAATGPRTVENTLRPYDDAQNQLAIAGNNAYLLSPLADAAALRRRA